MVEPRNTRDPPGGTTCPIGPGKVVGAILNPPDTTDLYTDGSAEQCRDGTVTDATGEALTETEFVAFQTYLWVAEHSSGPQKYRVYDVPGDTVLGSTTHPEKVPASSLVQAYARLAASGAVTSHWPGSMPVSMVPAKLTD